MDSKTKDAAAKVRISQIGDRYLLFEIEDIMRIRRENSICAVLVGNTPQAPNQTVFSGLPLELKPDEALLLVEKDVAFIEDDCVAHLARLRDPQARKAYADGLKRQRAAVQSMLAEEHAEKRRASEKIKAEKMKGKAGKKKPKKDSEAGVSQTDTAEESLFESTGPTNNSPAPTPSKSLASSTFFTPTTSSLLLTQSSPSPQSCETPPRPHSAALQRHLNDRGYFITPGLRFGGHFSAYPGDPFRYHAHYMASSYQWDQEIPLLDLVGTGRLATGVKKGFVFGGEALGVGDESAAKDVRAFTLEWAGI